MTTSTPVGTASRNRSSSAWVTIGPVGLLGVQTMTTLRAVGDRREHRVEAVAAVVVEPDLDGRGAGERGDDRVGLEGAPGEDHLVAGVAGGLR